MVATGRQPLVSDCNKANSCMPISNWRHKGTWIHVHW